ncbi:MAG TPA: toll/interleukin-1 receptor domain-containing protein [Gaiellaceae bacterium]
MTPGERITTITQIAAGLAERTWEEIDLVLDQFGFPTADDWPNNGRNSYVVAHIKNGKDDDLIALHDYVRQGEPSALTPGPGARDETAGGVWDPGYFRLFISHSSKQSEEVGALKVALRRHAVDGFVAHDDIEPTEEWQEVIEGALQSCEAVVAYLTPDFHPSKWTDQEIGVALARNVLIVPIRKGELPYGFMAKYQALPGANKLGPRLAEDLVSILEGHKLTAARFAEARKIVLPLLAIEDLERADTYNEATAAYQRVLAIPEAHLTFDHLGRIEEATKRNGQLRAQWNWGKTTVADEAMALVHRLRDDIPF